MSTSPETLVRSSALVVVIGVSGSTSLISIKLFVTTEGWQGFRKLSATELTTDSYVK